MRNDLFDVPNYEVEHVQQHFTLKLKWYTQGQVQDGPDSTTESHELVNQTPGQLLLLPLCLPLINLYELIDMRLMTSS